jgi:small subunit ribosomal protein S6
MTTTPVNEPAARPAATPPAAAAAPKQQRVGSSRDMAGRKREYETIYILRPDSTSDVIAQVNQKVRGVIEAGGGTLLKIDNWGKRKLAYEVKKQLKGIYLFFSYLGTAGLVEEVERNLRLTDSVIRYYSVKMAENVDPAARTSEFTEEAFTKAATPGPDEEEIATGQANVRSPFDEEEGAFDFEEAVFGGVDEPSRRGKD